MAAATHKGECQVCGSTQMLPNGVLSNHGYTVQFGFFEGVCNGSKALPFEQSKALIDMSIERAKNLIIATQKEIESLKETPLAWKGTYNIKKNTYTWDIVELSEDGKMYRDPKRGWRQNGHYGDLNKILHSMSDNRIYFLEQKIEQITNYINWQEKRIQRWEPKPLRER